MVLSAQASKVVRCRCIAVFRRWASSNAAHKDYIATVNVGDLDIFDDGAMITENALREKGLVRGANDGVKILGDGEVTKKFTIAVANLSAGAKEKIEKAGAHDCFGFLN